MSDQIELATFGAGCFWSVEARFRELKGVLDATSGYMGGQPQPTYEAVCTGTTGHAEVVQIRYDADQVSYEALLILFFVLYWVKGMKPLKEKVSKSVMLSFFILYLGLTLIGYFFRGENWTWTWNVREAYFPFRPDPIKPGQYFNMNDSIQPLQVMGRRETMMIIGIIQSITMMSATAEINSSVP